MYRYETHLHTSPVSACARASVYDSLAAYRELGYDGVFLTNHFLDANICRDVRHLPYAEQLEFYYSAYLEARELQDKIGIKVFFGTELGYKHADFLVYGLDIDWYRQHPEIIGMPKKEELRLMRESGAFIVHAHPFREASFIEYIRLFPRDVDAVEIFNASRTEGENKMAELYCRHYGLLEFAGTDNHVALGRTLFSGMECEYPIETDGDFIRAMRAGDMRVFSIERK